MQSAPEPRVESFAVIEAVAGRLDESPPMLRRRWSAEAKARIVEESLAPGANISAVARAHGLSPQQLFAWRRKAFRSGAIALLPEEASAGVKTQSFVAVEVARGDGAGMGGLEIVIGDATIRVGSERVYADETTLPTLSPGSGKTKTAWLWTYARDDRTFGGTAPPMVAYRFEDSRGGDCVERHLSGYTGLLQVDGWGAYNRLADARRAGGPLQLAACWAHLRRKFYELHVSGVSAVASETVERMAGLWVVEQRIRGQDAHARRSARQEQSAAVVADLWPFWEKELGRISGKSKLAEAIRYARSRREALERFLHDGRLDIDSNAVERAIRPQTITRKNALFAGSDGGGQTWATIATLLHTARMNGIDPFAWLTRTLQRIAAGWPNRDLDQLLPINHHAR